MTGVIKRLFRNRGFGFIKAENGKEIFFHATGLQNIRFDLLKEGDLVEFNIVEGSKSLRAVDIKAKK